MLPTQRSSITLKHTHNAGFTLIELMVVLGIIGILALSAYPSYRSALLKSKRSEASSALLRAMLQQERHYTQANRYVAYDGPKQSIGQDFIWFSGDTARSSAYQISATACANQTLAQCVQVSATPGGALVDQHFSDTTCGILSLNSRGEKRAAGLPLSEAPDACR